MLVKPKPSRLFASIGVTTPDFIGAWLGQLSSAAVRRPGMVLVCSALIISLATWGAL